MYLNINTGEYPRFDGDLENIGWIPGTPLPEGWVSVTIEEFPNLEINQDAILKQPEEIDGVWIAKWEIFNMTEEAIKQRDSFVPDASYLKVDKL